MYFTWGQVMKNAFKHSVALVMAASLMMSLVTAAPSADGLDVPEDSLLISEMRTRKDLDVVAHKSSMFAALKNAADTWKGENKITIDLKAYNIYVKEATDLVYAVWDFINKNPAAYFLTPTVTYSKNPSTGQILSVSIVCDPDYGEDSRNKFNKKVNEIVSLIDPNWSDVEKIVFIHDYIITHCKYDYYLDDIHMDAYSCLVNGQAVCQGYALAFNLICSKVGVESEYVSSNTLAHAWNMVTVDGKHYFVDLTYDDPVFRVASDGRHISGPARYCDHSNLLISSEKCAKTHKSDDWCIEGGSICVKDWGKDTAYDNMFWTKSEAPLMPADNGSWLYVTSGSKSVMLYDFAKDAHELLVNLPSASSHVSIDHNDHHTVVSTDTAVYQVRKDEYSLIHSESAEEKQTGHIREVRISGEKVYYTIYADDMSASLEKCIDLEDIDEETVKSIPEMLEPALVSAKDGISISWTKLNGISGYNIYRKSGNGEYKLLTTINSVNTLEYLDKTAKVGQAYTYAVTGFNLEAEGEKDGVAITRLKHVNISVGNASKGISISWKKISGASAYEIYRRSGKGGFKKIASCKGTSYLDKKVKNSNGTVFEYAVKAVNAKGGSDLSGEKITRISAPAIKSLKASGSSVSIKWSKVKKASFYTIDYTDGGKTYSLNIKNPNTTSISIPVKNGKTVSVKIRSAVKKGNTITLSAWSASKKA